MHDVHVKLWEKWWWTRPAIWRMTHAAPPAKLQVIISSVLRACCKVMSAQRILYCPGLPNYLSAPPTCSCLTLRASWPLDLTSPGLSVHSSLEESCFSCIGTIPFLLLSLEWMGGWRRNYYCNIWGSNKDERRQMVWKAEGKGAWSIDNIQSHHTSLGLFTSKTHWVSHLSSALQLTDTFLRGR